MFFISYVRAALCTAVISLLFLCCSKGGSSDNPSATLKADFTFSGAGTAPSTVSFSNASVGAITSYLWDFGDGSTSTAVSPSHTYTRGGAFTVRLTVTSGSANNSITKTVNITTPTSLRIMSVKVLQMPLTDPSGGGWDLSNGPDVYFTITDAANTPLYTAPTAYVNVTAATLPLSWTLTPPYTITNLDSQYKVLLWDQDNSDIPPNPDDFIGGYVFSFSTYAAAGYPQVITLQSSTSTIKIELLVQWL